ncbi:aspartate carbamoyltransferase catalytic subunit [Tuberibacillus sp. Marseille-P3662]|uniref:aspartate carbamoyltransferase catalytic subunit n=1 Tax=Tuberibacillus sp. Marseille-P3662 TaxID=1965358 RepID=UPI000A1CF27B|nr:aspartate carbamoyltransferase catalytic subunit [Tuberibacillus sp. Marseille-P3662]
MADLVRLADLRTEDIETILDGARKIKQAGESMKHNGVIANLFFEPSTRTRTSFEVAEKRLGFHPLNVDEITSSIQKGESLYDTIRTLEATGIDAVVIRHTQNEYYQDLQGRLSIPMINAGDGCGDHPTQTLLDLLTIQESFIVFQGLKVAIIGDLRHSRVAKSNAETLHRLGADVILSGPAEWYNDRLPGRYVPVDEAMAQADVVYMLRIQHERHQGIMDLTSEDYHEQFGLTMTRAEAMKPGAIIMHPAPVNRGVELDSRLIESNNSRIFSQIHNGVPVRMAVIEWAIGQLKEEMNDGAFIKVGSSL